MNKLEVVRIVARTDCYEQPAYDIVAVDGGCMVRAALGRYDTAREIAQRIDERMLYEREHGEDSLQTS